MPRDINVFKVDGFEGQLKFGNYALKVIGLTDANANEARLRLAELIGTDPMKACAQLLEAAHLGYLYTTEDFNEDYKPSKAMFRNWVDNADASELSKLINEFTKSQVTPAEYERILANQAATAANTAPVEKKSKPGKTSLRLR